MNKVSIDKIKEVASKFKEKIKELYPDTILDVDFVEDVVPFLMEGKKLINKETGEEVDPDTLEGEEKEAFEKYKESLKGTGGFVKPLGNNKFEMKINLNEDTIESLTKVWSVNKDVTLLHVVLHEFSHVVDFSHGVTKHFAPNIKYSGGEFFADYLAWYMVSEDTGEALDKTEKYIDMYFKNMGGSMDHRLVKTCMGTIHALVYTDLYEFTQYVKSVYKELIGYE